MLRAVAPGPPLSGGTLPGVAPGPLPTGLAGLSGRARLLAALVLSTSGDRWRHTRRVAQRARLAVPAVVPTGGRDAGEVLVAAAWLHDIGYAAPLARTGYHPVDGAEHLRATGWPEVVVALVAHHSGSRFVAEARGLTDLMAPYDDARGWAGPVADALTWADQTSGPDGREVTVDERLAEVLARHGADSPLGRCHAVRAPHVRTAAAATEVRLALTRRPAGSRTAESRAARGAERGGVVLAG